MNKETKKPAPKEQITIRASQKAIDNCKKIAEATNRTFSYVVNVAMEKIEKKDLN